MGFLLLSSTLLIWFIYHLFNRKLFTPLKFYYFFLFFQFSDLADGVSHNEIYFSYFYLQMIGLCIIPFEIYYQKKLNIVCNFLKNQEIVLFNEKNVLIKLYLLLLIPIFAQIYHIYLMGGIEAYLYSLGLRVNLWLGYGYLVFLKSFIQPVAIFFFLIYVLVDLKYKKVWLTSCVVVFLIACVLGFLSGSRSSIINLILAILIIYDYFVDSISFVFIISTFLIIFSLLILLNLYRNPFYLEMISELNISGILESTLIDLQDKSNYTTGKLGIIPLESLFSNTFTTFQFGLTYITAFTNFIPRAIWPDKPHSGGTVLTEFMTQLTVNEQTTSFSTGLIGEGIINFGYYFGYICAFFVLLFFCFIVYSRIKIINSVLNQKYHKVIKIISNIFIYISIIQLLGHSVAGEFTNGLFGVLKNYIFAFFIQFILELKTRNLKT